MSGAANEAGKLFAFQLSVLARAHACEGKLGCVLWVLWEWDICVRIDHRQLLKTDNVCVGVVNMLYCPVMDCIAAHLPRLCIP